MIQNPEDLAFDDAFDELDNRDDMIARYRSSPMRNDGYDRQRKQKREKKKVILKH